MSSGTGFGDAACPEAASYIVVWFLCLLGRTEMSSVLGTLASASPWLLLCWYMVLVVFPGRLTLKLLEESCLRNFPSGPLVIVSCLRGLPTGLLVALSPCATPLSATSPSATPPSATPPSTKIGVVALVVSIGAGRSSRRWLWAGVATMRWSEGMGDCG